MMEIFDLGVAAIPAITVLCYLAGCFCRAGKLDNSWIPAIMGTLGAVLGVLALCLMPEFPARDYITAAAIGALSGFAATGVNQLLVQSAKRKEQA